MENIFKTYRIQFGYIIFLLFIFFSEYRAGFFISGIILSLIGIIWRLWASGIIIKSRSVASSGPYLLCRHPLYFGSFIMGLGFSLICGKIIFVILFLMFFYISYFPLMKDEEKKMLKLFGNEYSEYMRSVPMFFPRRITSGLTGFSWKQVIKNKEYRAWIGYGIFLLLWILRTSFLG